jgi:glycogen phosphorylase
MRLAKIIVAGTHVWLNTPQPPLEASGTSGMKAALNGVPTLSVLDDWWVEGRIEGVTGWAIGDGGAHGVNEDGTSLYDNLGPTVLPGWDGERCACVSITKGAISKCGSLFSSHRMMRRDAIDVYLL